MPWPIPMFSCTTLMGTCKSEHSNETEPANLISHITSFLR